MSRRVERASGGEAAAVRRGTVSTCSVMPPHGSPDTSRLPPRSLRPTAPRRRAAAHAQVTIFSTLPRSDSAAGGPRTSPSRSGRRPKARVHDQTRALLDFAMRQRRRLGRFARSARMLHSVLALHDQPRGHDVPVLTSVVPARLPQLATVVVGVVQLRQVDGDDFAFEMLGEVHAPVSGLRREARAGGSA
jgi:hypothetical protein